jgi:hypothetical protein
MRHAEGLDAFLACFVIEEPEESLMRLYTIASVFFDNLKREFKNITLGK